MLLRCAPQVVQQINHAGEVNRARVMPQNQFMIATKTISVRAPRIAALQLGGQYAWSLTAFISVHC